MVSPKGLALDPEVLYFITAYFLGLGFPKWDSSIHITWELVRNASSPVLTYWIEMGGGEPSVTTSPPGGSDA